MLSRRSTITPSSPIVFVLYIGDADVPSIAPPPARQALLSPSQKRANHIQSEQKRRANIRRGYEALCEAVPALREAIRLEEAGLGADEKSSLSQVGKTVSKKKKKGKAGSDDGEKPIDGRAGPRSENVVLSKTIAYIQALMEERTNLTQRLTYARSALSHSSLNNHSQILQVSPANLDDKGVPLWEREWSGGTGWAEISGCDADDAEGEGDEEDGE
ncbi:hypothetical protein NLI96_g8202 [Meripilus lineatus]|uniref:BHLH domain-containing protein n=1 Tax=Meripilus lineatus TaxID=2056292 RepID=A0AAD5UXT0_9APHY|nr:hypothetical protein NLI96_g8202 [Physisporinus lineatus]